MLELADQAFVCEWSTFSEREKRTRLYTSKFPVNGFVSCPNMLLFPPSTVLQDGAAAYRQGEYWVKAPPQWGRPSLVVSLWRDLQIKKRRNVLGLDQEEDEVCVRACVCVCVCVCVSEWVSVWKWVSECVCVCVLGGIEQWTLPTTISYPVSPLFSNEQDLLKCSELILFIAEEGSWLWQNPLILCCSSHEHTSTRTLNTCICLFLICPKHSKKLV